MQTYIFILIAFDGSEEFTSMYAVILTGGKQYRVKAGQIFACEKIESAPGESFVFDKVLMVGEGDKIQVGAPYLDKATVKAEVIEQKRGEKVKILKFRRRKHHMKRMGHRQYLTKVRISDIKLS